MMWLCLVGEVPYLECGMSSIRQQATILVVLAIFPTFLRAAEPSPPKVGETAPNFELPDLQGSTVKLSDVAQQGPVVVIVLRGYPGYQCPLCRKQILQYVDAADDLAAAGAQVLLIYPGPVDEVTAKAREFVGSTQLPQGYRLLLDPGYSFTKAWHLRWDEPGETAYPSTFLVDNNLLVKFAKVSRSHGGRTTPAEVLRTFAEP
ncbi:MAG: redoxin domain-containing protein [Planctomycetaceae bacterium]|nr:redoxin domain-containing protein [Planctomycetaceae bacterium]